MRDFDERAEFPGGKFAAFRAAAATTAVVAVRPW